MPIRTLRLVVIVVIVVIWKRWHHQRAKFVSGREHTCVPDDVQLQRRHGSSEPTQQAQWIDVDRDGAIGERPLQLNPHETIVEQMQPLLRERWTQDVFAERLATGSIVSGGGCCRVEREASFGNGKSRGDTHAGRIPQCDRRSSRRSGPAGAAPPTAADASAASAESCSAQPSSISVGSRRLSRPPVAAPGRRGVSLDAAPGDCASAALRGTVALVSLVCPKNKKRAVIAGIVDTTMQFPRSVTTAAFVLCCAGTSSGCATDPPTSKRACFEAIDKGEQMLSVPDHGAAKGWLDRAKKDCLADQAQALSRLEKAIADSEARAAEREKKREESFKPKPASESLVPGFVDAVVKYRDNKKRGQCDADPCAEVAAVGKLTVRHSTTKGARDAFRVFTRFTTERVTCEQLGPSELKRRSENQTQIKLHCAITGGLLPGLFALLEQEKDRPETHVVVFSDKWLERDQELQSALEGAGSAP